MQPNIQDPPETLYNKALKLRNQVDWYYPVNKIYKNYAKSLFEHYIDLLINLQMSAYITANYFSKKEFKIDYSKIFELYENYENIEIFSKRFKHPYAQVIEYAFTDIFLSDRKRDLTESIKKFFENNEDFLYLFAHVTFPSLFCYYSLPETFNFAVAIIKTILQIECNPKVKCHLCSSFFESYPMFLSSLFEKYAEYSFSTVEKIEPFEKLILSIQHACKFLTYEHFNIIRGTDPILFKLIFIDTLLVPQFKIRYYDNDFANFLLNIQPDSEKFKRIMETFSCQRFYRPLDLRVYGSFSYMNMVKKDTPYFTWFPFYASMCEIKLLHGIILNFTDKKFQSLVNLPFKDTFKMNYSTTLYQIHIHLGGNFGNKMNELDELYQKGFLFQEKKYIIGKNEFKFKLIFNQIIKTSEKYKCDPIDFFLILNDHLKKQTSNQENQNVHQENQNPNQENQNSNQENQNVHQENQNVHQENQNVNQENQNPNQENQNVNQENHAFNPNHQILECPEVQTFRDIEAVISDPEFQIYFWKKLSNKYIKKINDLDVILAIKNCENSINEIENLMSRNLYNLMLYVTLNLNTTNFKTNEIDYNSTIFWKVLNEVYDFDQMKISNELVQCLEFDPTKVLLKQNEVEKLQIFMKNLFKVHYQTVVRFVPEIILMLKNRFKNIKKANDLELAVYNSFISIISKCKLEFSQFFCYYFKVADKNLNKMKRPPNYIREGWMYIYGLLNKFALKNNINLVQQFTEFFISD